MIAGTGVCGVIIYAAIIPMLAEAAAEKYPEFSYCKWPWLILIWITAVPCFLVLVLAWRVALNIGHDRSFSASNAVLLKWVSVLAAADAAIFFVGNLVYLLLNMNHPSIVLLSFFIEFFGVAVSVSAAALSHLVMKAAVLQEESDLTI